MSSGLSYSTLRWLAKGFQALIIIVVPFISINNNSLLRFDVPTLRLYFFGNPIWIDEFFLVLLASLFFAFLLIFITLLFGRIWCGWMCPQTVLNDITEVFFGRSLHRSYLRVGLSYLIVALLSVFVGANLLWYFVSPYEFFDRLFRGNLGDVVVGFWVVLAIVIFLNLVFIKRRFCASVCPYSKLQSVILDSQSMVIAFDDMRRQECMNCNACVRACPVRVDLREGLNPACINCAECIDVCKRMTTKVRKASLIDYRFGLSGQSMNPFRPQVLIVGLILLVSLTALSYWTFMRKPLDVVVMQNQYFQPRVTDEGLVINSYMLSLTNRTDNGMSLSIEAKSKGERLKVSPDVSNIGAKAHERLPIYIGIPHNNQQDYIDLVIRSSNERVYVKTLGFIRPEVR